jgi:hypothetical protein
MKQTEIRKWSLNDNGMKFYDAKLHPVFLGASHFVALDFFCIIKNEIRQNEMHPFF